MHKSVRRLGFIILISTLALGSLYSIFFYQNGPLAEQIFELFSYTITAVVSFYFGQKIGDKREEFQRISSENVGELPSENVGELKAENVGELRAEETPENPSDELLSNIPH